MSKSPTKKKQKSDTGLNRKLSNKLSAILLIIVFLVGLSLMLYPTVSDEWNSYHATKAISNYAETVYTMSKTDYAENLKAAYDYNTRLAEAGGNYLLTEEEYEEYTNLLNITGNGIMGYISIPKIDVMMPIYHGVSESVLQVAAGHIEWTSLPVGGETSHCVLSGHRGLPSAKLFTNLDKLELDDVFMLQILNETFTYQIDQIETVLPEEVEGLVLSEGHDYCTLVTCTPYGINTHRLLVRGTRIENLPDTPNMITLSEATQVNPIIVALCTGVPLILFFFMILLIFKRKPEDFDY